jgi:hypothetical protein
MLIRLFVSINVAFLASEAVRSSSGSEDSIAAETLRSSVGVFIFFYFF